MLILLGVGLGVTGREIHWLNGFLIGVIFRSNRSMVDAADGGIAKRRVSPREPVHMKRKAPRGLHIHHQIG
jgi:hypothetical protein